ncbi:sigma factor [Sphingobacterium lumbrici]|uniref:sigma factor n=1 Tax=Sphingobacterium lumbrici TaxID=2559600 RepID=UPI00112E215A|nr:sigma factor [Sphingobacterium lumbrici]
MNDFAADLFKRYYKGLCYFAWKLVGDSELAEDLAQDAFIAYLQRKENVSEDENSIRSFLYTAVIVCDRKRCQPV